MKAQIIILLCKIRDMFRTLSFYLNALRYPMKPVRGITIVANLSDGASLSKVMRDLAYALRSAGIPFQTYNLARRSSVFPKDVDGILTQRKDFRALRFTHIVGMGKYPFPRLKGTRCTIISFWEADSGYEEVHKDILLRADILVGMSDFNVDYFNKLAASYDKKSLKILYPFRFPPAALPQTEIVRHKYGLPIDAFVVFFNFDIVSIERKNAAGVIRAFAKAFPSETDVHLVFKTMHAELFPEALHKLYRLAQEVGISDRFSMINEYVPQLDLYGLTNACDAYISLHRGEGFGLGVAEAMAMGKPVVVTNWSATTEFCNDANSISVPYTMIVPDKKDHLQLLFKNVTAWADADIKVAASALRRLYKTPTLQKELGQNARLFMHEHFSLERFKVHINALLDS